MAEPAPAAWKALLLQRVIGAHKRARVAYMGLQHAKAISGMGISPEIRAQVGAVPWARNQLDREMEWLMVAALYLNSAVACMGAAEILAFHGGNLAGPSLPVPSIDYLDLSEPAVRVALDSLRAACGLAAEACAYTECCRGHVSMLRALLDPPGIPNAVAVVEAEKAAANSALTLAMLRTQALRDEVAVAWLILDPTQLIG